MTVRKIRQRVSIFVINKNKEMNAVATQRNGQLRLNKISRYSATRRKTFQRIENSLPGLDIESILMEIRWKGVRQRATIRPDLHALTPQARLIDNPYVIVMSVKSAERPPSIAIN